MLDPNFVELETVAGLRNPEFVQLHSVRHGEVGWGFDAGGALSLYVARLVGAGLEEHIFYVGREARKEVVKGGDVKREGE